MKKTLFGWTVAAITGLALAGCQPDTLAERMEDAAEDAAHETQQSLERAGDEIEEATDPE